MCGYFYPIRWSGAYRTRLQDTALDQSETGTRRVAGMKCSVIRPAPAPAVLLQLEAKDEAPSIAESVMLALV